MRGRRDVRGRTMVCRKVKLLTKKAFVFVYCTVKIGKCYGGEISRCDFVIVYRRRKKIAKTNAVGLFSVVIIGSEKLEIDEGCFWTFLGENSKGGKY